MERVAQGLNKCLPQKYLICIIQKKNLVYLKVISSRTYKRSLQHLLKNFDT